MLGRKGGCRLCRREGPCLPGGGEEGASHGLGYLSHLGHEVGEVVEGEGLGTILEGGVWIGMHLDHQAIGAGRHGGQSHRQDQIPFAGAMAGVSDDGEMAQLLEHGDRAYVHGIAGKGLKGADAPLAEHDGAIALVQDVVGR